MRWRSRLRTLRRRIPRSNRLAPVWVHDLNTDRWYVPSTGLELGSEEAVRSYLAENFSEDDDPLFIVLECPADPERELAGEAGQNMAGSELRMAIQPNNGLTTYRL